MGLPASKILEYKKKVATLAKRRRIAVEGYGVWIKPEQFNFNFTRDSHVPEKNLERTVDDSLKIAVKLGGSIEYCHGVGFRLGSFLPLQYGKGFDVMKKLKRQLDPQDILNRGKLGFSYSDQS